MAEELEFGSYPLHLYLSPSTGLYHVAIEHVEEAEAAGIPESFEADRYNVMAARGQAHGYAFVQDEPPAQKEEAAQ